MSIITTEIRVEKDGRTVLSVPPLTLGARRIGIIGRNGSGKSTLARMLTGLEPPDSGTVTLHGIDPAKDRKAALSRIGILFQNPDHQIIFPTVEEEIGFGPRQAGLSKSEARARAHEILVQFGRSDWAERPTGTLSQGQKHLLCLMATLATAPKTLLLDEPFAGLDRPTIRQLNTILAGLDAQILHISHDLDALSNADQILWIEAGQLKAIGGPELIADYIRSCDADDLADL